MVEFVFLFGPPCCGKTFLSSQLINDFSEKRYVRVSPNELFYKSPDLSLHKVINRIINLLQKGHSVILDDTQQSQIERTRRTYIQSIKAKIPNCNFLALLLYPEGGKLQSYWGNEFAFSEHSILLDKNGNTISPVTYREPDIENWFLHSTVPKLEEGFTELREMSSKFKIYQTTPFFRKVILLNASSILDFQPQHRIDSFGTYHLKAGVHSVLQEYLETSKEENPRIIILIDESSLFPTTLELLRTDLLQQKKAVDHFRQQTRKSINQLANFVQQPIFYLIAAYNMFSEKDFFRLPNPGMMAWLQFRHQIDLNQSIYVGPNITKSFCESAGIMFCDGEMFFKSSGWTVSSKISKFGTNYFERRPPFLIEAEYYEPSSESGCTEDVLKHLNNHFSKLISKDAPVEEKGGPGRIHGVCFPQITSSSSSILVDSLSTSNSTTHSEVSKQDRVLPDWMFTENTIQPSSTPSKKKSSQKSPQRTVPSPTLQQSEFQDDTPSVMLSDIKQDPSQHDYQTTNQNLMGNLNIKVEKEFEGIHHHSLQLEPTSPSSDPGSSEVPDINSLMAKHFGTSALSVFQSNMTNPTPNSVLKRNGEDLITDNFVHKKPKQSLKSLLE